MQNCKKKKNQKLDVARVTIFFWKERPVLLSSSPMGLEPRADTLDQYLARAERGHTSCDLSKANGRGEHRPLPISGQTRLGTQRNIGTGPSECSFPCEVCPLQRMSCSLTSSQKPPKDGLIQSPVWHPQGACHCAGCRGHEEKNRHSLCLPE